MLGRLGKHVFTGSKAFTMRAMSSRALVVAEHSSNAISQGSLAAITAASQLGGEVSVLVVGDNVDAAAKHASSLKGVTSVATLQDPSLSGVISGEDFSSLVVNVSKDYTHIVAASSNFGKNFMPRAAALMDSSPLTDVLSVVDHETFTRPLYAGNAIATVKMTNDIKFLLVRGTAFEKAEEGGSAPIQALDASALPQPSGLSTLVSSNEVASERPELSSARVVVAGGRGLKSGDNFSMLEEMADKLGGAVGASRAAVDAGFAPNDYQVGQTGKQVAPELYVAVGISGAIQHLSGMKDSKTIVAINKDAEAPIFQVADYGLVDDLFKAVPDMNAKL